MPDPTQRTGGGGFLMTAAALTIVVAGLKFAAVFLVPFLTALFLAVISYPGVHLLERRARIPPSVGVIVVLLVEFMVLGATATYIGKSLGHLGQLNEELDARVKEVRELESVQWLQKKLGGQEVAPTDSTASTAPVAESEGGAGPPEDGPSVPSLESLIDTVWNFIKQYTFNILLRLPSMFAQMFLVVMTMVFLLMEAGTVRDKLDRAFGGDGSTERFALIVRQVQTYLLVKTATSLLTGVCAWILLWAFGIPEPVVWGFLAFLLNYIPTIGSILAAIPPVLLAFLNGFPAMGLVALGYAVINVVIGNILEPMMMGRRMGLSTLIVFLSMVFWNLIWGPIGMILSVPLTMAVKIFLENSERGRAAAILMSADAGPEVNSKPGP